MPGVDASAQLMHKNQRLSFAAGLFHE
jgi:hypothetical protein